MAKIAWDNRSIFLYESGVDRGVFYPKNSQGVPWNGLISVNEKTESSNETVFYMDGLKYTGRVTLGDYSATIEAFTYPDEMSEYDGTYDEIFSSQPRKSFGLSYRTKIGNTDDGLDHGYKIHLVYNVLATPSDISYTTLSSSVEPMSFSWDITTIPEEISGYRPTSHLIIDTRYVYKDVLSALEQMLYGTSTSTPHFPSISEVLDIFEQNSEFKVIDHGDGSFSVVSPNADMVKSLSGEIIELSSDSVFLLDNNTYQASTL